MIITDDYVFFYSGIFSQWHNSNFTSDDSITAYDASQKILSVIISPVQKKIMYNSCEQYMMYKKAILFRDYNIAEKILMEWDCKKIKEMGRNISNFDQKKWDEYKYGIVYSGNYYKFTQSDHLQKRLLEIGGRNRTFVECSKYDKIWGIGLSVNESDIYDPKKWKGENLLGKAITEVRDHIIKKK